MPRHPRFLPPDNYYHIMNRGNNHMPIFICDDDYRFYLEKLAELKNEHPFDLYHYCLMGTHLHLLVKVTKESDFSNFSKRLNLSYFSYFKKNYGFDGHFWQGRFKSQLISDDIYFIQCGKYIELNPVKAGMVELPEDYPWSSYGHYAFGDKNNLLTEDLFYQELGTNDQTRQIEFRKIVVDQSIEEYMDKVDSLAVGDKKFIYNVNRRAKYHENNKNAPYRKRGI
jgi:putative transposase